MVLIAPPPPSRQPNPLYKILPASSHLLRIFNTRHKTTALSFRRFGPINRFDHQRTKEAGKPQEDSQRGIYYAGFTLSCCLVEYYGDSGVIDIKADEWVAKVTLTRNITLLDLSNNGAMRAGSVAALAKIADRHLSQTWSRFFYEETSIYGEIDGIHFLNAHNDEPSVALYERARTALDCPQNQQMLLDNSSLRPAIQEAAITNNMDFIP